jgi:hypothetical protein
MFAPTGCAEGKTVVPDKIIGHHCVSDRTRRAGDERLCFPVRLATRALADAFNANRMKGIFLAGHGARQQRRPGASGAQEKKMQREGVFREMKRLREAVRTFGPGAERSTAAGVQARSQEGPARGTSSGSARQEAANRQTVRTQWTVLGHGPAPGSHVGVVGLAS